MSVEKFIGYARKFLIALAAALGILLTSLADGVVTSSEWVMVALAFLSALGVYNVPNVITKEQIRKSEAENK